MLMSESEVKKFAISLFEALEGKIKGSRFKGDELILNAHSKLVLYRSKKPKEISLRINLTIANDLKWAFSLSKLSIEDNHFSCSLNNPSDKKNINQSIYDKLGIIKDNKYLFCKSLSFDEFVDKYFCTLNAILEAHIKDIYAPMNNYDFFEEFRSGKIPACKYVRKRVHKLIQQYSDIHSKIQSKVESQYKKKGWEVATEFPSKGYNRIRIDVVARKGKEIIFFEVKPYSRARLCIREALGQLLEYSSYYSNNNSMKATKLIVIGPSKPEKKDKSYLDKLNDFFNIPIYYKRVKP